MQRLIDWLRCLPPNYHWKVNYSRHDLYNQFGVHLVYQKFVKWVLRYPYEIHIDLLNSKLASIWGSSQCWKPWRSSCTGILKLCSTYEFDHFHRSLANWSKSLLFRRNRAAFKWTTSHFALLKVHQICFLKCLKLYATDNRMLVFKRLLMSYCKNHRPPLY